MAKAVNGNLGATQRGRPSKYNWDAWCDGRRWRTRQGVDFESAKAFRTALYNRATNSKLNIAIVYSPEVVEFQFYRKTPGDLL